MSHAHVNKGSWHEGFSPPMHLMLKNLTTVELNFGKIIVRSLEFTVQLGTGMNRAAGD
jgi:hypothetical protein